jgi:xanthine permease XanP
LPCPNFSFLKWSFDSSLIIPFAISSLCASVKTLGNITTCQKINDLDWKRPEMQSIKRGLLSDGMGMSLSGLLGGMGQSSASSNIGLSLATGATSSKIAYSTGGILIALAFLPRIAEIFVIMPQPVMGATPIFAVCFIVIIGLQMMMSRMMDSRKIFVLGISLIFGLSVMGLVDVYSQIPNTLVRPIFSSTLYLATLLAIALTFLFRLGLTKKVQLIWEPGKNTTDDIFSFMEIQGAAWGARREVIYKAISALNEIAETVTLLHLAEEKVVVNVRFDEFNLDLSVQYPGKPFPLQDISHSDMDFTDEGNPSRLSIELIKKLADKVTSDCQGGVCRVMLHFDY